MLSFVKLGAGIVVILSVIFIISRKYREFCYLQDAIETIPYEVKEPVTWKHFVKGSGGVQYGSVTDSMDCDGIQLELPMDFYKPDTKDNK